MAERDGAGAGARFNLPDAATLLALEAVTLHGARNDEPIVLKVEPRLFQMGELADPEAELAEAADEELLFNVLAGLVESLQFVFRQVVVSRSPALIGGLISLWCRHSEILSQHPQRCK